MKKTTLEKTRYHPPGKKFSIGKESKETDRPQYITCYFNEQFSEPLTWPYCDRGYVTVVGLYTGKLELMSVDTEIWLFDLV